MASKPKAKQGRTLDVVHSGMVLLSDGKGHGKPARLILTKEILTIQMPTGDDEIVPTSGGTVDPTDTSVRIVTVEKGKEGLGLSIKGGAEGGGAVNQTTAAPVVISKVIPGLPAAQTGQLFVGDKILEVNGVSVYGLSHEEVVRLLRDATGTNVVLVVQQSTMAPLFRRSPSKRRSTSFADSFDGGSVMKGALKSPSVDRHSRYSSIAKDDDLKSNAWKTVIRLPLPMAIVTRYLWGTDKIRSNAFELRTNNG
uniref:PDZ domain-containing protein n=1 Tax=Panagrolaimus davidi TaxID=227884 RepID=A0A914QMV4_9BILA